ncbi:MAG: GNAT family N-acetyltransferase [Defluviitaleaceae bacterium]|nr:GNAT family N-acetyltransferase [Defluviitaleaceae bacterium]
MKHIIRELNKEEFNLLPYFLYEAIFQRGENERLPIYVVLEPELNIYHDNFGQEGDFCLVAQIGTELVGAVWARLLSGEPKGFGYVDDKTPELAISLYQGYRNKGIGTNLLELMLSLLKENGYNQVSLSVHKDNYAVKMYEKFGFKVVKDLANLYLMALSL